MFFHEHLLREKECGQICRKAGVLVQGHGQGGCRNLQGLSVAGSSSCEQQEPLCGSKHDFKKSLC